MNSITKLCSIYGIGNYTPITKNARALAKRIKWVKGEVGGVVSHALADAPQGLHPTDPYGRLQLWKASPDSNTTSVQFATIPEHLRGLGVGRKMYGGAIRDAYTAYKKERGPRYFTSDASGLTSDDAQNLWKSLQRRGYTVEGGVTPITSNLPSRAMFGIDLDKMHDFYKDAIPPALTPTAPNSWLSNFINSIKGKFSGINTPAQLPSKA